MIANETYLDKYEMVENRRAARNKTPRKRHKKHNYAKIGKNLSNNFSQPKNNKTDYYCTENCCIQCDTKGNLCKIDECKKIMCIECSWYSRKRFPHCRHTRIVGNVIYPPDEYFRIFGKNKEYMNKGLDKYIEEKKKTQ